MRITSQRVSVTVIAAMVVAMVTAVPAHAATVYFTVDGIDYQVDDANVGAGASVQRVPSSGDLVIPASVTHGSITYDVTTIAQEVALEESLTSVVIPDTVTVIGDAAFSNNRIGTVSLGSGVTTIGAGAFSINRLTALNLPASVTTIGGDAFASNDLAAVVIPAGVTTLGQHAFATNPLTSVEFVGDAPTSIGYGPLGTSGGDSGPMVTYRMGATGFTSPTWTAGGVTYRSQALATVTFDTAGHTTPPAPVDVIVGNTVTEPTAPTATGQTFTGWSTQPTGGTIYDFATPITDNTTLYAQWEAIPTTEPTEEPTTEPTEEPTTPTSFTVPTTATPGQTFTLTGSGFAPGESIQIWLLSTPTQLGATSATAAGQVSISVTIPTDTAPGQHHIEVRTATTTLSQPIAIQAVLATSGPTTTLAWIAALLLALGAALVHHTRRRHTVR